MNHKRDIKRSQLFAKRYNEVFASTIGPESIFTKTKRCIRVFFVLLKEFGIKQTFCEIRIRILRFLHYRNSKENIGILVNSLDKGGLEQVIYNTVTNAKKYQFITFIVGNDWGEIGYKLYRKGFLVIPLAEDFNKLKELINKYNIKLINSHYSVWKIPEIKKDIGIKVVYTIHSMYIWLGNNQDFLDRCNAYNFIDKFFAVSEPVKNYFAKRFQISPDKIQLVENGFNPSEYPRAKVISKSKRNKSEFVFLSVGSLVPIKNHILMISALKKIKELFKGSSIIIEFVGSTPEIDYLNFLKKEINKMKLKNEIRFVGELDKKQLVEKYKKSNCLLLTSIVEGSPNVILEAMFFGLPIISLDVGDVKSHLGNNGIIIPNIYADVSEEMDRIINEIPYDTRQKNLSNLVIAMASMIEEYDYWINKSKKNRVYIQKHLLSKHTVSNFEVALSEIILYDVQ